MFNIDNIRAQFPILSREINGKPLAYLAIAGQMSTSFANVHRGLHTMANETTEAYEGARAKVASFLGAPKPENIITPISCRGISCASVTAR